MKQRIYVDTSVIGGVFDEEFSEDTKPLFEKINSGNIILVYSDITIGELKNSPEEVKNFLIKISEKHKEKLEITKETIYLADAYIKEQVVGKTSRADCIHIALATLNKIDILVSWNFKHIVNINRIRGYNSVNLKLGYQTLEIRTPREVIDYKDENIN